MNEESNHFNYYFIETKDQLYYLSSLPNTLRLIEFLQKKLFFYGAGYSAKSLSQDELEDMRKKGVFKGKPLYKMV